MNTVGAPPSNVKGMPPPTAMYVQPGLQPGAWQHPVITPPTQPRYQSAPGPYQQPQQVVVVVNAPNFGKIILVRHTRTFHILILNLSLLVLLLD